MRETSSSMLIALRTALMTLLLTGILYPVGMTGLCAVIFPARARGSLVSDEKGQTVGSLLLGQRFTAAGYFQPRPSAAGELGYDAMSSAGPNLGPTSRRLQERARQEIPRLQTENPESLGAILGELVAASASGLDPHLSPASALWQVPRVAQARGLAPERVRVVISDHLAGRELGFLGEPRVNVLLLNLALDKQLGRPRFGG